MVPEPKMIMFAGGGTGGHLFPGISLAQEFNRRFPDLDIVFAGTRKGLEARVIPPLGYRLVFIKIGGLVGKGLRQRIKVIGSLPRALIQALILLVRYQPDLVVGLGGYASAPVLVAARMAGIPLVIQEQNAFPGLVNRCLAPFADVIFIAFDKAREKLHNRKIINAGNPIRAELIRETALPPGKSADFVILVLGGSLGAHSLNKTVPVALVRLKESGVPVRVIHQTGSKELERVREAYQTSGIQAEVADFFADMGRRYAQADLVICRAGALTLAELALLGRPAVLIPYPHAAHDHQQFNAQVFVEKGAALMMMDQALNEEELAAMLTALYKDPDRRRQMAMEAASLGRPRAAAQIIDTCLQVMGFSTLKEPKDENAS
ncbi:MAG: undecaprenyldiphospho-muramoylpentapeptide beta-N-acetylglucosaminyltransferase [Xanthomonadaceae bacterium]|nr:undecaprenyldiphospho-muramoylpentapeptide beta-N-acetylglucosaminyltransferase [Xanthomonadaceae bacterium]